MEGCVLLSGLLAVVALKASILLAIVICSGRSRHGGVTGSCCGSGVCYGILETHGALVKWYAAFSCLLAVLLYVTLSEASLILTISHFFF